MAKSIINPTITIEEGKIHIDFFLKNNASKIRLKERRNYMGEKFLRPDEAIRVDSAYVEWQIGYDTKVKKDGDYKVQHLEGDNYLYIRERNGQRVKKYPAELMVIIKYALDLGFLRTSDIERIINLTEEIYESKNYLDNFPILGEKTDMVLFYEFKIFKRILPLAILEDKDYFIEMERKQMQFAAGYQSMIYVCPYFKILQKREENVYAWVVDESNINIFEKVLISFALASEQHNRDIKELLEIILKNI